MVEGLHVVHGRHDLSAIARVDEPHAVAQPQRGLRDAGPRHQQPAHGLLALAPGGGLDPQLHEARLAGRDGLILHAEQVEAGVACVVLAVPLIHGPHLGAERLDEQLHAARARQRSAALASRTAARRRRSPEPATPPSPPAAVRACGRARQDQRRTRRDFRGRSSGCPPDTASGPQEGHAALPRAAARSGSQWPARPAGA
mmetsp:Transcript_91709/g.285857  ORF Transcript_91709/g.285857 Transcript_91709/m.285857 type:complete len:200 (+) Transcript_91709:739-1338(+)